MATPGSSIENPVLGVKIRFLQTGRASAGHMLKMEWTVAPGKGRELIAHFHPEVDERFEIKAGQGQYQVGKEVHYCKAGDDLTLPRATPHIHPWNTGEGELVFVQTVTLQKPDIEGLERAEATFEHLSVMAQKGLVNKQGLPRNPLKLALVLESLQPFAYLAGQPVSMQRAAVGTMAALARKLGHKLG